MMMFHPEVSQSSLRSHFHSERDRGLFEHAAIWTQEQSVTQPGSGVPYDLSQVPVIQQAKKIAVKEEVIASHTGKTLQQLPIKSEEKVAQCTGYMTRYASAGGSVSFGGKSRGVYDIGGGRWGYIDTSHGEIEAFPAEQTEGTTTHIIPLRFDYDEVEKTIKGVKTTLYRITNISRLPAVAVSGKKAHTYTMN
jgi:hypothetical protein